MDDKAAQQRQKSRGQWKRQMESVLSLAGFAIGLSSLWRFPYMAMRNGGGAFLIPYIVFTIAIGIPLVFMETALGQYFQLSPLLIFDICPLFKGVGISITVISFIGYIHYMTILAWTLYFLAMSFKPVLPWTTCDNSWNTNSCVPIFTESISNLTNVTLPASKADNLTRVLAVEEFWRYSVLDISSGIEDPGPLRWQLLVALLVAYALVYVCIFKGVESTRIAVYITATAPFLLLVLFLIWLLTRPGSSDGLLFYITPRWEQVVKFQTWLEGFIHVFYSLGPGWGGLINLASYNPFHYRCLRDSVIVVVLDVSTALLCGAVVFAGVGCIAYETGKAVDEVITTGPGLAFMTYPHLVTYFPVAHFWIICFFLLILTMALDCEFAQVKTVTTGFIDLFPEALGKRKSLLALAVLVISVLLGLPFITHGGMYAFQIVDWYGPFFTIMFVVLIETIVIGWLYGGDRFLGNIEEMGLYRHRWILQFMKISWKFFIPVCMATALVVALVKFRPPSYGDYTYPDWTNVFGWLLAVSSSLPIPVVMVYTLLKTKGTLIQRLKSSIKPRIGRMGFKEGDNFEFEERRSGDDTQDLEVIASMSSMGLGLGFLELILTGLFGFKTTCIISCLGMIVSSSLIALFAHYNRIFSSWPSLVGVMQLILYIVAVRSLISSYAQGPFASAQ
ncbi:sodium- and chloride-dependent GABA transporter 1-like [Liolophura sinensis]|uniref:sodium- and chloride-dependent GABA transporter 1-like n=1 Tax=Liolophura sinensis TaxID=3198878 RepID=UPI003159616C